MKSNMLPVIVVVAFNRSKSLKRLLNSLKAANYEAFNVTLIISIDKAKDNQDIVEIAKDFKWNQGDKIVSYNSQNLGLRKHIIKCADYSQQYGSVIILEDDLFVAPNFYLFAQAALNFSNNKEYIGGISLYNHRMNVHTKDQFQALDDGYSNWYFQFASSWGQAWTNKQWSTFKEWYKTIDTVTPSELIPVNVSNWSDKSWLKFFIVYLIKTDKYFLYPRTSYSTNFSDQGTHMSSESTIYQVPLNYSLQKRWVFSQLEETSSVYDAFFENNKLHEILNKNKEELYVDLYGYKPVPNKKFHITTLNLDYKIIKKFGKTLKPHDANVLQNINGNDLFLYDREIIEKNPFIDNRYRQIMYNIRFISDSDSKYLFIRKTSNKLLRGIKRILSLKRK